MQNPIPCEYCDSVPNISAWCCIKCQKNHACPVIFKPVIPSGGYLDSKGRWRPIIGEENSRWSTCSRCKEIFDQFSAKDHVTCNKKN